MLFIALKAALFNVNIAHTVTGMAKYSQYNVKPCTIYGSLCSGAIHSYI